MFKKLMTLALALAALAGAAQAAPQKKWKSREWKSKEKRFEPVIRADVGEYAGRYQGIDESYILEIESLAGGRLKITSIEGTRRAEVRDLRIEGAQLRGTKVYEDGERAKFEGFFADRVLNGERAFGVVVSGLDIKLDGQTFNRTFYRQFTKTQGK